MKKGKYTPPPPGSSHSTEWLLNRNAAPQVSALMVKGVSDHRRELLHDEVKEGKFRDGTASNINEDGLSPAGSVSVSAKPMYKSASLSSSGFGGAGNSVNQIPEVYSPLWLTSNLNLPRDRATINAWCRAFFTLNPFVQNAINLHSTYPISKLNIKCHNPEVAKFFNDMVEELDLMNICVQIAQEFWLLGEAFIYAEMDQNKGKWRRLIIQNPDYMVVKRTVVASEPLIEIRPDQNLQSIVRSNKPSDIEQRKQLDQHIIDSVKRGGNIPLSNFNVSHLARKISPYEIRGTGLPVCIFRQLMLYDKLRESKFAQSESMINPLTLIKIGSEGQDGLHPTHADLEQWREVFECYDEETEVLTENGFKKFNEVIEYKKITNLDSDQLSFSASPKKDIKIACFNPETEYLEYHKPTKASVYNYDGDMYHFKNQKIDLKVTPNHDLWVSKKEYIYNGHRSLRKTTWGKWNKIKAKDLSLNDTCQFRSEIKWSGNNSIRSITVAEKEVPVELFLEFLGYLVSEGCVYSNGKSQNTITITQTHKKYYTEMKDCLTLFAGCFDKSFGQHTKKETEKRSACWSGVICSKELHDYFKKEIGTDGNTWAEFKKIPKWVFDLSPRLLKIFLKAAVMGDGSQFDLLNDKSGFAYYSTSKELADGIYEIAYKCGYVPTMSVRYNQTTENGNDKLPLYTVLWSESIRGRFPKVYKTYTNSETKEKTNILNIEKYKGKVWCFTVPTGLFITRRNGRITVQGNSGQANKDFKIFTHPGVTVEKIGSGAGIYDISGDITQLIKEMYVGLQVPPVLMDGGADTTYANGGVALDVLRQRYMTFRNMLSAWLRRKIFAPISEIQGFYEYKPGPTGKSEKHLIIPEIDWNHMSLFDAGDYINTLVTLTSPGGDGIAPRASLHTLYRSMGLEWEDEQRKLRKEAIQAAITKKESAALQSMELNELRSLSDEDEIPEPDLMPGQNPAEGGVPGEVPGGGLPPPPDMNLPGLGGPPLPPAPPPGPPPSPEAPPPPPPK